MNGIQKLFDGMRASSSGMAAERVRIDVVAKNLANAEVTHTPTGGPYRRQVVRFAPMLRKAADGRKEIAGVHVAGIEQDKQSPFERVRIPGHPDADENGWVTMPNVNPTLEMADLMTAVRAYEANANAAESFSRMAERALRLAQQ
jgi:flagellar basal-body rod protein FlgC